MNILNQIGVFGAGIPAFFVYKKIEDYHYKKNIGRFNIGLFVVICVIIISGWFHYLANLWICNWAFAFLFLIVGQAVSLLPVLTSSIFVSLGKLSFSLYLCHPLVVYLLKPVFSWIYSFDGISLFRAFVGCFGVTIFFVIPIAFMSNRLIERQGIKFGRYLINRKRLITI